jgi:hypothetical protein
MNPFLAFRAWGPSGFYLIKTGEGASAARCRVGGPSVPGLEIRG